MGEETNLERLERLRKESYEGHREMDIYEDTYNPSGVQNGDYGREKEIKDIEQMTMDCLY